MTKPSVPSVENALSDPLLVDWPVATLQKLGRRYAKDPQQSKTPKTSLRVAINAGFTADYLAEILPLFFAHRGFDIEIYVGPYGGLQTEILDSGSAFWTFDPDLVYGCQHTETPIRSGNRCKRRRREKIGRFRTERAGALCGRGRKYRSFR